MDAVNKESSEFEEAETSLLEISTNNQDDTVNYQTADEENSSKYFSMVADSSLEGVSSADVTLENKSVINDSLTPEKSQLLNNLTNIQSKSSDKLQIHEKIDAAKILSGGVDIFDDNENSSDEQGLVIDYDAQGTENVDADPASGSAPKEPQDLNKSESKDDTLKSEEEEQILKGAEEELAAIESDLKEDEKTDSYSALLQSNLPEGSSIVTLLIDDKNVEAIDIGEGVYIYKNDDGELTAIQITLNEDGTTNFKCLHVGKNEDGNLEVYEEQVSQVPVTTEELESMRSQELNKETEPRQPSHTTPGKKENKPTEGKQPVVLERNEQEGNAPPTPADKPQTVGGDKASESEAKQENSRVTVSDADSEAKVLPTEETKEDVKASQPPIVTEVEISSEPPLKDSPTKDVVISTAKVISSQGTDYSNDKKDNSMDTVEISSIDRSEELVADVKTSIENTKEDTVSPTLVEEAKSDEDDNKTTKPLGQVPPETSDCLLAADATDSQDSTSNLSIINEESSNTIESVVSSCPSINPTESIMSGQLSINDSLCIKINETISDESKSEVAQPNISEELSQGESVTKSIGEEELSSDSNAQSLVIEDNTAIQDTADLKQDNVILKETSIPDLKSSSTVSQEGDLKSVDESTESQTSMESDDEDYMVGEPVTGDCGTEWNNKVCKTAQEGTTDKTTENILEADVSKCAEISSSAVSVGESESVKAKSLEQNISDNNNDVAKGAISDKDNSSKSNESSEMIIKEIDFDKFVRRTSIQMFEECVQVDYEDVKETLRTKSVPILEMEYKEEVKNNCGSDKQLVVETNAKVQHISPTVSRSSKSLDISITTVSSSTEKTPSPVKNAQPFKPTYSPVENNKYMNAAQFSVYGNQTSKLFPANKSLVLPTPTQSVKKPESVNLKPRTYLPVHKTLSQNLPTAAQVSEKALSFGVLNDKQSYTLLPSSPQQPATPQAPSLPTPSKLENVTQDVNRGNTELQSENTSHENDKSKVDMDSSDIQKAKGRQPRKQVFTPVTSSAMEIIFPNLFNNAQEYKKESDAKALKLKKEQDMKFRQLSRKEQSKRAEKANKPPAKIVDKISPIKPLDKSIPKDSTLLSTPVKSFDKSMIKDSGGVKFSDKPVARHSPIMQMSPMKTYEFINTDVVQPLNPIKSPNEVLNKNLVHLASPVKSFDQLNSYESPKVSSPLKTNDVKKDQTVPKPASVKSFDHTSNKESSYPKSPIKNSNVDVVTPKNLGRAPYAIDLPGTNVDKNASNHFGVDSSRLKDYSSPRTYSRFMTKPPVQQNFNVTEPTKHSSKSPTNEKRNPISEEVKVPPKNNDKIVKNSDQSGSNVNSKVPQPNNGNLNDAVRKTPNRKNSEVPNPVGGADSTLNTQIENKNNTTNVTPKSKVEEVLVTPKTDKPFKSEDPKSHNSNSAPNLQFPDKTILRSPLTSDGKSLQSPTNTLPNTSPGSESAKRKRGRPKKIVTESPALVQEKQTADVPIKEKPEPVITPKVRDSECVIRKDSATKRKSTVTESPKLEEKSRASSISPFGKIDENIKCPMCFKTFRSHNVLIKHVKHCNGTISVEVVKTPKRRKLTDSLEASDSVDAISEDDDKSVESKISTKSQEPAPLSVESTEETKVDSIEQPKQVDSKDVADVESKPESDAKEDVPQNKDDLKPIAKDVSMEVITLEDSVIEVNSSNIEEPSTPANKKAITSRNNSNTESPKKRTSAGRPAKDKKVADSKESTQSKRNAAASPGSGSTKVVNMKPPANEPIACTVCGKTFRQLAHMVYHRSSKHNVEEKEAVSEVKVDDTNVKSKSEPVETQVETDTILKCETCHKGFRKLHHLVEHREMHANTETKSRRASVASVKSESEAGFRCDTCDKSFRKLHHLVEHRELHLAEVAESLEVATTPTKVTEPKPVEDATCPGCGKTFRKRYHMVEHRDIHCSPSKKGKPDDSSSTAEGNIRLSVASSNSDEGNSCGICGKSYRKLHHMVEHRESHAEVREEKAKNKNNPEQEQLNTKDIIHECSRCYMVFPNENSLNKHIDICSKKRVVRKSLVQPDEEVDSLNEKAGLPDAENGTKEIDAESNDDVIVVEPEDVCTNVEKQNDENKPVDTSETVVKESAPSVDVSEASTTEDASVKSSETNKTKRSDRKSIAPKQTAKSQVSTLFKDTISSRSRKSAIMKRPTDTSSVSSRASSARKSSASSESVSSRTSIKRKSSSSVEHIPIKRANTKDSSVNKPVSDHRRSLDSIPKKHTKAPLRRSLQNDNKKSDDDDDSIKYKFKENDESNVKYKINPEFSKSIKRLSLASSDGVVKAKARKSESALTGLKITKERVLQTISEEADVRYSFPKSSKGKAIDSEQPTSKSTPAPEPAKKPDAESKKIENAETKVVKKKVIITKKTNIVVANRRKSLGGRKSIDAKKLPIGRKKLELRCCSLTFNSQADLATHRKTHKDNVKVHKCDCGKVFDTEGLLKRHMDIEHTPPKSYKCTLCGASIRTAVQFAKHKKDHEAYQKHEKPAASKKLIECKTSADRKQPSKTSQVSKSVKVQSNKNKSPVVENRKGVKRKTAHGGVPLSDKMKKAMAGAKFQ